MDTYPKVPLFYLMRTFHGGRHHPARLWLTVAMTPQRRSKSRHPFTNLPKPIDKLNHKISHCKQIKVVPPVTEGRFGHTLITPLPGKPVNHLLDTQLVVIGKRWCRVHTKNSYIDQPANPPFLSFRSAGKSFTE